MTAFEVFDKVWNEHFQAAQLYGHERRQNIRNHKTQDRYEGVLFSIWKHHNDWDDENGFEIKCFRQNLIYRVIRLADEAGLLIKSRNYYVGSHTNEYHKNNMLFDQAFRGPENKFGRWLNDVTNDKNKDIYHKLYVDEFSNKIKNPRRKQRGIEDFSLKSLRVRGNKSPAPPVFRPKGRGIKPSY